MASSGPVTLFGHVCSIRGQKTASFLRHNHHWPTTMLGQKYSFTQVYINFTDVSTVDILKQLLF